MAVNPQKGHTVYVDSNSLVYAVETPKLFPGLRRCFVLPFMRGELRIVTRWITLAEVLVKPLKAGDAKLEAYYRQLVHPSASCSVLAVDYQIASSAAAIRAQHGIRLPDAIHIASGQFAGCTQFLTGDSQRARVGIPVIDPAALP